MQSSKHIEQSTNHVSSSIIDVKNVHYTTVDPKQWVDLKHVLRNRVKHMRKHQEPLTNSVIYSYIQKKIKNEHLAGSQLQIRQVAKVDATSLQYLNLTKFTAHSYVESCGCIVPLVPALRSNSRPESSTSIRTKRSFTSPTTTPNLRMSSPRDSEGKVARREEAAKCSCDTPPNLPSPGGAALPQKYVKLKVLHILGKWTAS